MFKSYSSEANVTRTFTMVIGSDSEMHLYRSLRVLSGMAAHLVTLGFTIFVAVTARPGTSLFSWHPFLMSLAFSFFMTEAVLVFSPESSPIQSFSRKVKARCHWVLQVLAVLCALLGLAIIIYNKYINDKPHFATWHGLIGLISVMYACGQSLGGVSLLYPKLVKGWSLAKLKLYHATSGLVGYLLGTTSLLLGMCSLWFTASVTGIAWYLAVFSPVLTGLVIMNQVSNTYLSGKRMKL
ncbi:transmembrane reductase CYB561D2 [Latimeria chalumnae]|uniref:ascorbate ferrireductase (transmembrane) n=1 Tax=Latimeria chalumnae TaxID=7897 RepID=H3B7W2_LATCH|nr:PREDICTED: cytochrome b561 domain-containing protein 2 [Latimeria chalumnae]XP_005992723.1 PREDICTED: cytochrome b561 domain-containing protein 2 [Latimeria chalumnae]XP_014341957.1 PREDICTED: cytochrome b561 domain-containing protein 2 [Latimeria chalumnae]XP_014341958.1 PREDICTED: cytochrome b561 domain-containing protein 2 [Latimeria chalumnae]|eukprot:XP_005992722.1 PREDICTED: cytochrome b561 domain-containing protein 2 [Latimeria chalumnae]